MNIITTPDGKALMAELSAESYDGHDVQECRDALQRHLGRLQDKLNASQPALDDAEQMDALRCAQEAQQSSVSAQQVAYMIRTLSKVEAWLDGLSLSKPADDAFHKRLLMRSEVAGVRDMLLNAAVHPVSVSNH